MLNRNNSQQYQWVDLNNNRNVVNSNQDITNTLRNTQTELQTLVIRNSHNIQVVQLEAQALLVIQAALQAAIQATVAVLGNQDNNVRELQRISQNLTALQSQTQSIVIDNSDGISVNQVELQVDIVVQAAINLLAQIALKLG